jgi:hypothetical protein
LAAATLYLAVAAAEFNSAAVPVRILFDGVAPLRPYRWVHPPEELANGNQAPEAGMGAVSLDATGSTPTSANTGDGQAIANVAGRAIPGQRGQAFAVVRLTPLDPTRIAPPPPGFRFDGNAYRIEIIYAASGKPVGLRGPLTVALRYATGGTSMVHSSGTGWTALPATKFAGNLNLLVTSTETAGVFAVVAPQDLPYRMRTPWRWYALFLGIPTALALLIGFLPRIVAHLRRRPAS